jgi:hypothetical protein
MQRDTGLEEVKQQLKTIEARLNRILDLINPPIQPTPSTKEKVEEKTEDVVVIPKKERKPKTAKKAVKKVAKKAKK